MDKLLKGLPKRKQIQIGEGIIQKLVEALPFELHIPGYSYCGPGTKLDKRLKRGDKPINWVDEVCMKHDIAYSNSSNQNDIKEADKKMLSELESIESPTLSEKIGKTIAKTGIKAKMLLGSGIYCLKCKKHAPSEKIEEIEFKTQKGQRKRLSAVCSVCSKKKSKIIK